MIKNLLISIVVVVSTIGTAGAQNIGTWVEQETEVPVRGLMGIAMADSGNGYAVGDVDVLFNRTGVLRKRAGDPVWRPIPPSAFSPPLTIALSSWAQDVFAIPNTGTAFISWRDDYRSLIYKTNNYGQSWFNVSPLNPILYGTRYAIVFRDQREGMIVGEGPGRVHITHDGGIVWTSHTIASNEPLTDVKFSGTYWDVVGGENTFYRFNTISQKWFDLSFRYVQEFFPTHLKCTFIDDDNAYVSGYNEKSTNHIIMTTDGGRSWGPIPQQPSFKTTPEGHKGIYFFDRAKGWAASDYNEFAYTTDGGYNWTNYQPQLLGGKTYRPVNKMIFLNEAMGWAVGGQQRSSAYPSLSDGWIFKWVGTQFPNISSTATSVVFDTITCKDFVDLDIQVVNSGTGTLNIPAGGATLNNNEFSIVQPAFPLIIPPGMSKAITVRWKPHFSYYGPTAPDAELVLESNDAAHSPWKIQLNGIKLISLLLHSPSITIPKSCIGDSTELVLHTWTEGNFPSILHELQFYSNQGELELVNHAIGDTLQKSDSLMFRFRSTKSGPFSMGLTIVSGFASCPERTSVAISGFAKSNELKLVPAIQVFGDVCVGEAAKEFLALENVGTDSAFIMAIQRVSGSKDITLQIDSGLAIAAGRKVVFPVHFTPASPDSATIETTFRIISGPCIDTTEVLLLTRGITTILNIHPDSLLHIGIVPINRPAESSFLLENPMDRDAEVTSISVYPPITGLNLTLPSLPLTLVPQGRISIPVTWTPTAPDSLLTQLRIITTQPCADTLILLLQLHSDAMPLIVVRDEVIFDTQLCDEAVKDSLHIGNEGLLPLVITELDLESGPAGDFHVLGPSLPIVVPPGEERTIYLAYQAERNSTSSTWLHIWHNDLSKRGHSVVNLNARRRVRTLTIEGDTLTPILGCKGSTTVRQLVLKNLNDDAIQLVRIEQLVGTPDATLLYPSVPRSLAAGDSVIVEIHADAVTTLLYDVQLRITTEPCFEQRVINLKAGTWQPKLYLHPDTIAFGVRSQNDTGSIIFTIQNQDSLALLISAIEFDDASASITLQHPVSYPYLLAPDSVLHLPVTLNGTKHSDSIAASICVIITDPCADTVCTRVSAVFRSASLQVEPATLQTILAYCEDEHCDTLWIHNPLSVSQVIQASISPVDIFSLSGKVEEFTLSPGMSFPLIICARLENREQAVGLLALDGMEGYATVTVTAIRDAGKLSLRDTLDAGNVPYCESSQDASLFVRNNGLLPLTITEARVEGAGWSLQTPLPLTVIPGDMQTIQLRFTPSKRGEADPVTLHLTVGSRYCEREQIVALRGRHGSRYLSTEPHSLIFPNVTLGTRQTRQLLLRNHDMDGLRLWDVRSSDDKFTVQLTLPQNVDSAGAFSIPVTYTPTALGSDFAELCLYFDKPCFDTLCVSMEGTSVDGVLRLSPFNLVFDTLLQCQSDTMSSILSNTGTVDVTLRSSEIVGTGSTAYTLLNPVVADELLNADSTREFRIRFAPMSEADGSVEATMFLVGDAAMQPVTELQMSGEKRTQMTGGSGVLALGQVVLGAMVTGTVTVVNSGTAAVTFTDVVETLSSKLNTPLPFTLSAGENVVIEIQVVPWLQGVFRDTLRLRLSPCDGVYEVIITGNAVQSFTTTDMQLGELPFCHSAEGLVTVRNNGSEAVRIDSLSISGAYASRFSFITAPALPLWLDSGTEKQLTLRCTPLPGDRGAIDAMLKISAVLDNNVLHIASVLGAYVFSSTLDAPAAFDVGVAAIGEATASQNLVLRNNSNWPCRFDGIVSAGTRLTVEDASATTVPPGDSLILTVHASPDVPGVLYDTLVLHYTEPCDAYDTLIVSSEGVGDIVPLQLRIGDYNGAPGDTVAIALRMDKSIEGFPVNGWTAAIGFNASMLYPLELTTDGTASALMNVSFHWNHDDGIVTMTASGEPSHSDSNTLIVVRCLVLIGNNVHTFIEPLYVDFAHPTLRSEVSNIGSFTLEGYCLDDGNRLVHESEGIWLGQSVPNPASASVRISFYLDKEEHISIRLYDTNGREVAVVFEGVLSGGRHESRFDIASLPAGHYLYVLSTGSRMLSRGLSIVK